MTKKLKLFDVVELKGSKFVVNANGVDYRLNLPLSNHGNTFTPRAASELIYSKLSKLIASATTNEDPIVAIEFSKFDLLQILMQEDCEGIRFTFCCGIDGKNEVDPNSDSLVAIGIDSSGDPIRKQYFDLAHDGTAMEDAPIVKEKGNGIKASEVNSLISPDPLTRELYFQKFFQPLR